MKEYVVIFSNKGQTFSPCLALSKHINKKLPVLRWAIMQQSTGWKSFAIASHSRMSSKDSSAELGEIDLPPGQVRSIQLNYVAHNPTIIGNEFPG